MEIQVNSAKLTTEQGKDVSRDEVIAYARNEVEKALSVFEIEPISATITLHTEGSKSDPVQKVDIKVVAYNRVINQSSHSRSAIKAIDRAIPDLKRQMKKMKTKKIDKGRMRSRSAKDARHRAAEAELAEDMA